MTKFGQWSDLAKLLLLRVAFLLVCYTAVFSVVTQRSLRDDTKNGYVADYFFAASMSFTHEHSFSTFGNVRNNSVTKQHGGLEISSSGFELVWKSVVFCVFPAVFPRLFVTQQRRGNGRRLGRKVMNNGF